jgi:hypothetical protein
LYFCALSYNSLSYLVEKDSYNLAVFFWAAGNIAKVAAGSLGCSSRRSITTYFVVKETISFKYVSVKLLQGEYLNLEFNTAFHASIE